jgi:hypothetical protein
MGGLVGKGGDEGRLLLQNEKSSEAQWNSQNTESKENH